MKQTAGKQDLVVIPGQAGTGSEAKEQKYGKVFPHSDS